MFLVAGIDPLGTVSGKELFIVSQTAYLLYHRDALIFGYTGIDCGLIDKADWSSSSSTSRVLSWPLISSSTRDWRQAFAKNPTHLLHSM
jgi:hypothetical protein